MREKDITNNIYSMKRKKPKFFLLFFITTISFSILWIILFQFKTEKKLTIEGIYYCLEDCYVKTMIPLEEIKKLKTNQILKIENQKIPLKIEKMSEIMELENIEPVQSVVIKVPKQDFFEKQTIELQIIKEKECLIKEILKAMKGGE